MLSPAASIDLNYEFEAPQFHDFRCDTSPNTQVDEWFDAKKTILEDDLVPTLSDKELGLNTFSSDFVAEEANTSLSIDCSTGDKNDDVEGTEKVLCSPLTKILNKSKAKVVMTFSPGSNIKKNTNEIVDVHFTPKNKTGTIMEFSPGYSTKKILNVEQDTKTEVSEKSKNGCFNFPQTKMIYSPGYKMSSNKRTRRNKTRIRRKSYVKNVPETMRRTTRSMSKFLHRKTRSQTGILKSRLRENIINQKRKISKHTKKKQRVKHLTEPISPALSQRRPRPRVKSSASREIEQIMAEKRKFNKLRTLNARTAHSLCQSFSSVLPVRSTKPLTEPDPFILVTAARATLRSNCIEEKPNKVEKDEPKKPWSNTLTKIEPFEFHTQLRAEAKRYGKPEEESQQFVSSVQVTESFFGSLRTRSTPVASYIGKKLTIPEDPKLMTAMRRPRPLPLSTEEMELEEIRRYKAKVKDLSKIKKVLSHKKKTSSIKKKPLTSFYEFKLSTSNAQKRLQSPPIKDFKPITSKLKKNIFKSDNRNAIAQRVKATKRALTKPVGFDLSKTRKRKAVQIEPKFQQFKATPYPPLMSKSKPVKRRKPSPIKIQEFKLHTEIRGAEKQYMLRKRVESQERKAKKEKIFKAQPIPNYQNKRHSKRTTKRRLTKTKPFSFMVYDQELKEKKKASSTKEKKKKCKKFKAQPIPLSQTNPFVVSKSSKPLTIITSPQLNTMVRSEHRKSFDLEMVEKKKYQKVQEEYEKEILRKKERREIKKLRSQLIHHPVKIPDPKSPSPRRVSNVPLTVAQSPVLFTKLREEARQSFRTPRTRSRTRSRLPR